MTRVGAVLCDDDSLPYALKSPRDCVADLAGTDDSHRSPIATAALPAARRAGEGGVDVPRRPYRPAGDGLPAREARPARSTWRNRVWLRVTIETATEHATGGPNVQCEPAPGRRAQGAPGVPADSPRKGSCGA